MPAVESQPARDEDGFRNRGREVTRLEAFVDAAFAFAVTLIVISFDQIPKTTEELLQALKSMPMFAACFLQVTVFWRGHADWSRRFGLDDNRSRNCSLLLIFLVLVFVYPLRMVFSSFFAWISGGWLPANLSFSSGLDVQVMFMVFAVAFGSMGAAMLALYFNAWHQRDRIGLDAAERLMTRYAMARWSLLPAFAVLSLTLAVTLRDVRSNGWLLAMPGMIFFALTPLQMLLGWQQRRALRRCIAAELAP